MKWRASSPSASWVGAMVMVRSCDASLGSFYDYVIRAASAARPAPRGVWSHISAGTFFMICENTA